MAHLDLQTGTYRAAESLLNGRSSRKVGHNTVLHHTAYGGAGALAVRYHSTDVYTMTSDGWAIIRTGGWYTTTTSARVNALLPGPWRVAFSRGLYFRGHLVTPYTDGLAVKVSGPGEGSVGFASPSGNPVVLLTPADVAAIVTASEEAAAARDAKRAARRIAQHAGEVDIAEVRRVGDRIAEAIETGREPLALHTATFADYTLEPHGRARAWDCPQCQERQDVVKEYRLRILRAEHDIAVRLVAVVSPPTWGDVERMKRTVGAPWTLIERHIGRAGYGQADTTPVRMSCPWDCPLRSGR